MLLAGSNLQNNLSRMTADITMMFRQILVTEEDRKLQLILWRESEDLPIETYSLKTVTYGTTPAP